MDGLAIQTCLVAALVRAYTSNMATVLTYRFLEDRPKSAYRQLFIKGTRIRAEIVYRAHVYPEEPRTPEQLAADFALPLEAVREAIDYGRSEPPEIAADIAREAAIMAAAVSPHLSRSPTPSPGFFRQRNGLGCFLEPSR
jgi:uncharacterized protein (DUF433 family)